MNLAVEKLFSSIEKQIEEIERFQSNNEQEEYFAKLLTSNIVEQKPSLRHEREKNYKRQEIYFAKYLCVFICGSYQSFIEDTIKEYATKNGNKEISNYFEKSISHYIRNPNVESIVGLLKIFDESWANRIKNIDNKNRKAIDSIVTHKNKLAHEGYTDITLEEIKQFYEDSKIVIETISEIFC